MEGGGTCVMRMGDKKVAEGAFIDVPRPPDSIFFIVSGEKFIKEMTVLAFQEKKLFKINLEKN